MLTLARRGQASAPLVITYLVPSAFCAAHVPASWSIVVDTAGKFAGRNGRADVEAARALSGSSGPLVVVAWSAGCQAARSMLASGVEPIAVVALDGTSADWPELPAEDVDPWRVAAGRARRGASLLVITATQQTYTEHLARAARVAGPYASTVRVASIVWADNPSRDVPFLLPGDYEQGALRIEVHASATIDGGAHVREVREHGPRLLRDVVVPWVEANGDGAVSEEESSRHLSVGMRGNDVAALQTALNDAGASPRLSVDGIFGPRTRAAVVQMQFRLGMTQDGVADAAFLNALTSPASAPPDTLGVRALRVSEREVGAREEPNGSNRGPRVDLYTSFTGTPGQPWCASFEGWCRKQALLPGEKDALGYHARVASLWAAAVHLARARAPHWVPRPGDLAIFKRAGQDPRLGQDGHVGRVVSPPDAQGRFVCIEGNAGNAVARVEHSIADGDLVGWVEQP